MSTIAVIGCGYWGPNLIRNFRKLTNCHVLLCCDHDPQKLDRMKALFPGIQTTPDVNRVIQNPEVDAVAIATPVRTHFELAKNVLTHDKHAFVEKHLSHT